MLGSFTRQLIPVKRLVLKHKSPQVVRVRKGSRFVLQAHVEAEEDNLWFYGPVNRQIGDSGQRVGNTREEFVIQFHIWMKDCYQTEVYTLKGFDVWSNERRNWPMIVQVAPEYHVTFDTASTCCVTVDKPQSSCVTWKYYECGIVINDADSKILKEYNQCGVMAWYSSLKSPHAVRMRDGYLQTLQAYVKMDGNNLSFFGQGTGNIGYFY
ncbi:uncharacterized protein [Periplaneta americana]|uniref:uncharacterized protein isoform X2 n=1 Tax=Periplaneta americana TaxID=6978 RepID=UPI0037E937BE